MVLWALGGGGRGGGGGGGGGVIVIGGECRHVGPVMRGRAPSTMRGVRAHTACGRVHLKTAPTALRRKGDTMINEAVSRCSEPPPSKRPTISIYCTEPYRPHTTLYNHTRGIVATRFHVCKLTKQSNLHYTRLIVSSHLTEAREKPDVRSYSYSNTAPPPPPPTHPPPRNPRWVPVPGFQRCALPI